MTDFSDRIDSLIDGEISSLHSFVNLFLITGIAGTFYGLFHFAQSVTQGGSQIDNYAQKLNEGMANAFPVGFVGLVLTFFGHLAVSSREGRLREAAAKGMETCFRLRKTTTFFQTLSGSLKTLEGLPNAIAKSLEPIKDLENTLDQTLRPVISSFEQQLKTTSGLIQSQFELLQGAVSTIQRTLSTVSKTVESLHQTISGLPNVLETLTGHANRANEQVIAAGILLDRLERNAIEFSEAAKAAATQLGNLPSQMRSDLKDAFSEMALKAGEFWKDKFDVVLTQLANTVANHILAIERAAQSAASSIDGAAGAILSVAVQCRQVLENSIPAATSAAIEKLKEPVRELDEAFRRNYPEAIARLSSELQRSISIIQDAKASIDSLSRSAPELDVALKAWQDLESQLRSCTERLEKLIPLSAEWSALRNKLEKVESSCFRTTERMTEIEHTEARIEKELQGLTHNVFTILVFPKWWNRRKQRND
ncbi:MAG TPA: hypothetical protein VNI77_11035 [Nitrososphaera sp.]|nr:hypothetical protein [Nitrososphaera sp.]